MLLSRLVRPLGAFALSIHDRIHEWLSKRWEPSNSTTLELVSQSVFVLVLFAFALVVGTFVFLWPFQLMAVAGMVLVLGLMTVPIRWLANRTEDRRTCRILSATRSCPTCQRICGAQSSICPRCETRLDAVDTV